VNLENVYNLDLAHEETILSMHDATDADGKEVAEEMVEVITTVNIIVDEVSTVGGELNAADEEPISVAPTNITTSQPSEATKTTEHVPTPSSDPLPSGEDSMPLKELMVLCTNFSNKVLDLENGVIKMKYSHKAKIVELESKVEKLEDENRSFTKELKSFNSKVESSTAKEKVVDQEKSSKQGRKIADIDADAEVNLENVYNLDLAHEETILSMHDATDADGKEVAEEMVEVITTVNIIVDEVSTVGTFYKAFFPPQWKFFIRTILQCLSAKTTS
nr:hypothetical protein [Tanacetum cinerariifolium]